MRRFHLWLGFVFACLMVVMPSIVHAQTRSLGTGEFRPVRLATINGEETVFVLAGPDVPLERLAAYANHDRPSDALVVTVDDIVRRNPGLIRYVCGATAETPRTASRDPAHWLTCPAGAARHYGHALDWLIYRVPHRHVPTPEERMLALRNEFARHVLSEIEDHDLAQAATERLERRLEELRTVIASREARITRILAEGENRVSAVTRELGSMRRSYYGDLLCDLVAGVAIIILIALFWRGRFLRRHAKELEAVRQLQLDTMNALGMSRDAVRLSEKRNKDQAEAHALAMAAAEADAQASIISERESLKVEHAKELAALHEQARREMSVEIQARERIDAALKATQAQLDAASTAREKIKEEKAAYDALVAELAKIERKMAGYQDLIDRHQDLPNTEAEIAQLRTLIGMADQDRLAAYYRVQEASRLLAADFEVITGLPYTTESLTPFLDEQRKELFRLQVDAESAKEIYTELNERRTERIIKLTQTNAEQERLIESLRADNERLAGRLRAEEDAKSMLWSMDPKEITRPIHSTEHLMLDAVGSLERSLGVVVYRLLEELREDTFIPLKRATQVDFVHLSRKETSCCECRTQIALGDLCQHYLELHGGIPARHRLLTDPLPRPG